MSDTKTKERLNVSNVSRIDASNISTPHYRQPDNNPKTGIVHIGPGAFFRAHQAWYTHRAMMNNGGDWCITGVSMNSTGVADALNPQQGLYCLAELDERTDYEIIGAINKVLVAQQDFDEVISTLCADDTHYVTLTITEKGYCLNNAGELDLKNPVLVSDLGKESKHRTAIGLLSHALKKRFLNKQTCLCIISCDNVTENGKKLHKALIEYAKQLEEQSVTGYSEWLIEHLICPSTMVDSITPATDDSLREKVAQLGINDQWPIKRESFVQWVIEDTLPQHRPSWDKVGAIFTHHVDGFEKAKLRLLNCPHSTLAYIGCLLGLETVYDAMQNKSLVKFVKAMIDQEILPSVKPEAPAELDAEQYSDDILARFRNPSIRHLLSQIAWDGSQKIPMRVLPIIEDNLKNSRSISHLCVALSAWILFTRRAYQQQAELVDPLYGEIFIIAEQCKDDAEHDINLYLSLQQIFALDLRSNLIFVDEMRAAYKRLLPLLSNPDYQWNK